MAFKLKSLPLPYSLHSSTRQNPNFTLSNHRLPRRFSAPSLPLGISLSSTASASRFHRTALVTARAVRSDEIANEGEEDKDEELSRQGVKKELANKGIWSQMKDIVMFTGPATGLWICAPLMSLIDTAVIGQRSSIELAALGPATVVCDYMSYVFMFLSIATSNMVATALAKQVGNRHVRLLDGKLVNMMHIRSRSVTLAASMLLCVVSEVKLHFVLQGRMVPCGFSSQILEHGLPYILLPYEDNIEL